MGVYNKDSKFVGLSTESAYFLLSNIGQLVNVIQAMDTKTKNTIDVSFPKVNGKMAKIETQPKWAKVLSRPPVRKALLCCPIWTPHCPGAGELHTEQLQPEHHPGICAVW